mmetsp:Transcript_81587/g.231008  ORF Transcript_81587/g.231008 Transcript_81587/m.231008 type:complete len:308 (-) Transcript_81587:166-1089(-)
MVQYQHRDEQLAQVNANEGVLCLDQVVQQVNDPLELEEPQQPQHAHGARALQDLAHLADLLAVLVQRRVGDEHQPLRAHDDHVRHEPSHQVVPQDLLSGGHVLAFLKVAQEEALEHVPGPEQERQPLHGACEPVPWRLEGLHEGYRDEVVAYEEEAREVPAQPEAAVGEDDAGGLRQDPLRLAQDGHGPEGQVPALAQQALALPALVAVLLQEGVEALVPEDAAELPVPGRLYFEAVRHKESRCSRCRGGGGLRADGEGAPVRDHLRGVAAARARVGRGRAVLERKQYVLQRDRARHLRLGLLARER